MMPSDCFDRIAIVHAPERCEDTQAVFDELRGVGLDPQAAEVRVADQRAPGDSTGWPSRAVHANFLGHLSVLRQALQDGLRSVWILEDDAILSRRMRREGQALAAGLRAREWDMCFLGHSLRAELAGQPPGLVEATADFVGAHCYAVHGRVLPRLVAYLEQAAILPRHHPHGSRIYIYAAFTLFRQRHPDVVTLLHNPTLSIQARRSGDRDGGGTAITGPLISLAHRARDRWWKLRA